MKSFRLSIRVNSLNFLIVGIVLLGVETYVQNDYKIVFERIVLGRYNKSEFQYLYAKNVFLNRTYKAMNFGFESKRDWTGDDFKVRVEAFQYLHNEYRSASISFDSKICHVLETNLFGMESLLGKNGNLTSCPLKKGVYVIRDLNIDASKLPPHFPRGRWQIKLTFFMDVVWLSTLSWFGSAEDVIKY